MTEEQIERTRHHLRVILGKEEGVLADSLSVLDAVAADAPGELRHFLQNRSYAKAEIWLDGSQPPRGTCGGRHGA